MWFFKGVGSISGKIFFLGGSGGVGFGAFFSIWVVLMVFLVGCIVLVEGVMPNVLCYAEKVASFLVII